MRSVNKGNNILVLKYIGTDGWSRPVYQDQFNHLWKDIDLGYYSMPTLCSACNDEFDGEPDMPIEQDFTIRSQEGLISNEKKYQYMMLGRLKSDCEYYLGNGNRNSGCLHQKNENKQLEAMKAIWNSFNEEEKPEWLTWKEIIEYEKAMCVEL